MAETGEITRDCSQFLKTKIKTAIEYKMISHVRKKRTMPLTRVVNNQGTRV